MIGGRGARGGGLHRRDGVARSRVACSASGGCSAGALERVVGLRLRRGGAGLCLLGRREGGLGDLGGLEAGALLGGHALLGAADLGMRVGADGGELGLELLGVREDLQCLQGAVEVVGEALRDAAQGHAGEADGALAAVVGAAGELVVAAAPAGAKRGLRVVLGELAVPGGRPPLSAAGATGRAHPGTRTSSRSRCSSR